MTTAHWMFIIAFLASAHTLATWLAALWQGAAAQYAPNVGPLTPRAWPFVSVIVPAWRERGTIESCICALRAVEYPAWEAIIVAGGPDGTYESAIECCEDLDHM